jgi:hypothetical protein
VGRRRDLTGGNCRFITGVCDPNFQERCMNPQDVAPMIVFTTLIVVTGGVVLLRPLAKRFGDLIDVTIAERRRNLDPPEPVTDQARLLNVVESVEERLSRLEDRQAFTDSLLSSNNRSSLESGPLKRPDSSAPASRS